MAVTLNMSVESTDASGKGENVVEAYVYSIQETSGSTSTQSRTVSVVMYAKRIDYNGTLSGCTCSGSSSLGNFSNNIESYTISYLGSKLCSFTLTVNANSSGKATLGSSYYINVGTYASSGTAYRAIKVTFTSLSGLTPYTPSYTLKYYNSDGTTYATYYYTAGTTFTALSGPTKSDGTVADSTFLITGDANGGYFGNTSTTTTSITATKSGKIIYTFTSWNTNNLGTGTKYNAGTNYSMPASNLTLYPIYSNTTRYSYSNNAISSLKKPTKAPTYPYTYTVNYDANEGVVSTTSESVKTTRNWNFEGWGSSRDSTSADANSTYENETTVYAYWTYQDSKGKVTLPTPTRTGYAFLGWGTSASQTSGLLAAGATPEISSNITYVAIWKANGNINICDNENSQYSMGLVWLHDGTNWHLAIPWLHDGTEWKIIAG